MCGITGSLGFVDRSIVQRMTNALRHRGPDADGIFVNEPHGVVFGHRRLAIIDLSEAGRQPMSYANGRFWITFNGEIYNYIELRNELERSGYQFATATDTEVLLAAYAEWGERCLQHLRGMFAFAIYDQLAQGNQSRLFLARDYFGIKPLYYAWSNGRLLFASEIKSLLVSGQISHEVDHQAIWDYLSLGSIPLPRTILSSVRALPPGHAMRVSASGINQIWRYWDLVTASGERFPDAHTLEFDDAARELRRLLEEATRLHMIADVPVGAFLSGGIDSTAVVGLMSQYVTQPIKTFAIGFEGSHHHLSELHWAKLAAQHFGTEHTEVILNSNDITREYSRLVESIDQPSLDGTNTYFVSQATRPHVTVSLSGLGGDELFAGYPHFARFTHAAARDQRVPAWRHYADRTLLRIIPPGMLIEQRFAASTPITRHAGIRCLADEIEKRRITIPSFQAKCLMRSLDDLYVPLMRPEIDVISQVSYVEMSGYLSHTLLRDVDAMSMAYALEVRPVLLDHIVAMFAFALPAVHKLKGSTTKAVFVESLRDILPESIVRRPKKGFELPLFDWLSGPLYSRACISLQSSMAQQIFSEEFLLSSLNALRLHRGGGGRLWAYVMLLEWLNMYRCQL